ncbi:MAG: TerB family tellurite resistance protein [Pseudomonadaceae bacterium]|nr:TerB family tellurite resistance protein [Pseudomonadaceae bacterium]
MSIASLAGVLKIFGGSDPSPEEQAQLAKEVMLMTLARATAADTNIKAIEIEKVRDVLRAHTGEDFPAADVRVAANSRIYESAPLDKYIATSAKKLSASDRQDIAQALAEVINADGRVSSREITFFNQIAASLSLTPAQLMGLKEED